MGCDDVFPFHDAQVVRHSAPRESCKGYQFGASDAGLVAHEGQHLLAKRMSQGLDAAEARQDTPDADVIQARMPATPMPPAISRDRWLQRLPACVMASKPTKVASPSSVQWLSEDVHCAMNSKSPMACSNALR